MTASSPFDHDAFVDITLSHSPMDRPRVNSSPLPARRVDAERELSFMASSGSVNKPGPPGPKLLEEVKRACRGRQFSARTIEAYCGWIRRYVIFHGKRHPRELDADAIASFLTYLAAEKKTPNAPWRGARRALFIAISIQVSLVKQRSPALSAGTSS